MITKKDWYQKSVAEALQELDVDPDKGLNNAEVSKRQEQYPRNELPRGKKTHWWQLLWQQFLNPLIFILLVAAGVTFWLDERVDTVVIILAVIVNVAIGFWQEFQSNRIFETLQKIVLVTARVRRNDRVQEVLMAELVPGDILILKGDTKVPADARVVTEKNLLVNEAILTGESHSVDKTSEVISGTKSLGDRKNMIFMGTLIERGEGTAVVVATGGNTEIGHITALTTGIQEESTPLQERLGRLGKLIGAFVLFSALAIFAAGVFDPLRTTLEMFTVAVAVAVAAIPEGLPAALSVVLAVAASKILNKKGLIKKLVAAETLGSTTVVVTDKTGTITEGIMEVKELIDAPNTESAAQALLLSSNVLEISKNGQPEFKGDSTDKAKAEYAFSLGLTSEKVLHRLPRAAFLPFDEQKKYIASFHQGKMGGEIFVSGAPEILLQRSKLTRAKQDVILRHIENYASQGYRLVGAAHRIIRDIQFEKFTEKDLHATVVDLEFLGVAVIHDPIRSDVKASLCLTREAGIRVIMATGDHRLTAESIGRELEFHTDKESIITGDEIDTLSEVNLRRRIDDIHIVARVSPAHKMRIVEALKENGEVVAMTGDGINDAPALRAADIGVALGSGTDVTKETADLVLLDDSFSIITAAIRQGRIAFDNIRKVTIFLLANSFSEIILVGTSLLLRLPLPITAVQILWANLVEDGLPNFALAFEPGEKDIMRRKPLKRREPILDKLGMSLVYAVGIFSDIVLVGLYLTLFYIFDYETTHLQTVIFTAVAIDSLIYVFSIKSLHEPIFREEVFNNTYLLFAVAAGFLAMGLSLYTPALNYLLGTIPLGIFDLGLIFGAGVLRLCLIEVAKWRMRSVSLS